MTRAKEKIILVADKCNPSEFVEELRFYPEVYVSPEQFSGNKDYICEECGSSRLELAYPNRINGYAWQCSLSPYCSGKSKFCTVCKQAPLFQDNMNNKCMGATCVDELNN